MSTWTKQPNRQKALETTIPALCSILFALVSGVFVAAAMTESKLLDAHIQVHPLILSSALIVDYPMQRRLAVLLVSALAGACFYKSLLHCVWAQMSHFDETLSNPDIEPVQSNDPEERTAWILIQARWNERRIKHASLALLYFETGMYILPLSMIFLLSPRLFALGFYAWVVSLYSFIKALNRSQYFRRVFTTVR